MNKLADQMLRMQLEEGPALGVNGAAGRQLQPASAVNRVLW